MKPQSIIPFSVFLLLLLFQTITYANGKYKKEGNSTFQLGLSKTDILANPLMQSTTLNLNHIIPNFELPYTFPVDVNQNHDSKSPGILLIKECNTEKRHINKKCLKYKKPHRAIQYLVLEIPFGTLKIKQIPVLNF